MNKAEATVYTSGVFAAASVVAVSTGAVHVSVAGEAGAVVQARRAAIGAQICGETGIPFC